MINLTLLISLIDSCWIMLETSRLQFHIVHQCSSSSYSTSNLSTKTTQLSLLESSFPRCCSKSWVSPCRLPRCCLPWASARCWRCASAPSAPSAACGSRCAPCWHRRPRRKACWDSEARVGGWGSGTDTDDFFDPIKWTQVIMQVH